MNGVSYSRERRALLLYAAFGLFFLVLVVRLLLIQTAEHEKYYKMSEDNRIRLVPEVAFRGDIYDRYGRVIVENRPSYTISAIPNEIDNIDSISSKLADLVPLGKNEIAEKIRSKKFLRYQPIKIARSVSFETVCIIEENADKFPGIIFQLEPARKYPQEGVLSHAVGYTSEVTEKELREMKGEGVNYGTDIGREGLEKYWDRYLRGKDGLTYLEITAEGKILGDLQGRDNIPPEPGMDVQLALDYELQNYALSLFADTVAGALVALDPRNGEVLTFVSVPAYDANMFTGVLRKKDWDRLVSDPHKPLLNRIIKGEYPPASTYKLIVSGAGLEEGIIEPETKFAPCTGGYRFGNRVFKCWNLSGHGKLGVIGSIIQSCDVYFYQLGHKLGLEKFAEYSRKCGFGSKTGIDVPGEMAGLVPDADWYDNKLGKGKWPISVIINLSIGQGEVLVTPLQLANFYAAVANGGTLYRPHLMRMAFSKNDTVYAKIEKIGQLPFTDSTLAILREASVGVLYDPHGTARGSRIKGIKLGGTPGTAKNPHGNEHALFCAYAPVENPIIAVACIVENAGHGSEEAAPIVSRVVRHYLEKNGLIPDPDSLQNMASREAQ